MRGAGSQSQSQPMELELLEAGAPPVNRIRQLHSARRTNERGLLLIQNDYWSCSIERAPCALHAGYFESMKLVNFMCHSNLEIEFGCVLIFHFQR